jgi:FMN phosphatase YigB (HAD superfamily)
VLLDGGGVIIDESGFEDARARAITGALATLLPWYSTDNYRTDIDEAVKSFCPDVYRYVIWKYTEGNLPLFEDLWQKHLSTWLGERPPLKLYDGVADEIRELASTYTLAIAGQYGREILDLLESEGLINLFANRFTQDDYSLTKPDPRYFEEIAGRSGANLLECVMVGDRVDKDVIPAKQLGMKTVLVRTGIHRKQRPRIPPEMPDFELEDIRGLAGAVAQLAKGENTIS